MPQRGGCRKWVMCDSKRTYLRIKEDTIYYNEGKIVGDSVKLNFDIHVGYNSFCYRSFVSF